jgi:hypothetical protein
MKKLMLVLVVLCTVSIVVTSCAANKNGAGCPTATKSKKFTA